jgi:hypothetical protein
MSGKRESNKKNDKSGQGDHWYSHPAVWVGTLAVLLFLFMGAVSWRPASRWLSSLADKANTSSPEVVLLNGESGGQTPVTVNTTSGPGGGSGGGSGGGGGGGGDDGGGGVLPDEGILPEFYAEVGNGDTLPQLLTIAGTPDDCIETTIVLLGLQKVCTWANDESSVIVTLINDQVVAKTKLDF